MVSSGVCGLAWHLCILSPMIFSGVPMVKISGQQVSDIHSRVDQSTQLDLPTMMRSNYCCSFLPLSLWEFYLFNFRWPFCNHIPFWVKWSLVPHFLSLLSLLTESPVVISPTSHPPAQDSVSSLLCSWGRAADEVEPMNVNYSVAADICWRNGKLSTTFSGQKVESGSQYEADKIRGAKN